MGSFRFVHVGVAALLGAATVAAAGLVQMVGAAGVGTPSVLVPITPCRLFDTRTGADNVGTRATPLGPTEAAVFQVTGTNGNCTIPASATGIATNATAVNATSASYVTFYPADASPRPTASNLNVEAGAAPTPNQVTVGLSAAGAIGVFNRFGTVDVVVDIVGYYQASTGGAPGPQGPQGPQGSPGPAGPACPPAGCTATFHALTGHRSGQADLQLATGCFAGSSLLIPLDVPLGAVITNVRVVYRDADNATAAAFNVFKAVTPNQVDGVQFPNGSSATTAQPGFQTLDLAPLTTQAPVTSGTFYTLRAQTPTLTTSIHVCQAQVTYHF